MQILITKTAIGPRITDAKSADEWAKLKPGVYRADIKRMRNPRQFRLYWALINVAYQSQDTYATQADLSDVIKVAVGHCSMIKTKAGHDIAIPKSIAFGNMPQDQWEEFFDKVVKLVCEKIIPGTNDAELRAHLSEMVGMEAA